MTAILRDDFNADSGWIKTGSHVDATRSVSGGVMTMTFGTTFGKSAWTKSGLDGRNAVITVRTSGGCAGFPQIHFRETNATNFLLVWINATSGALVISKYVAGVRTDFQSQAITGFSSANDYTFSAICFENCLHATIIKSTGQLDKECEEISVDVSGFTGTAHGIGLSLGTQAYDWVDMRIIETLVNVDCVGDSNVGGTDKLRWPELMHVKRLGSPFIARNHGTGGYSTQNIYDERATRIDPYLIPGARNILAIATGNNDFAVEGKTAAQAFTVQQTLMSYAHAAGWECSLHTLIPFPYAGDPQTFVDSLNTLIRANETTYNYKSVEIHNAFGATDGNTDVTPSTLVNADRIHYSITIPGGGHELAAKTILHAIARNDRNVIT